MGCKIDIRCTNIVQRRKYIGLCESISLRNDVIAHLLQVALEARETAAATLGALQGQGQQVQRVNRDLDAVLPPTFTPSPGACLP